MNPFDVVSKIPGIVAAILSDESGNLLESVGNIDGESAAAVNAFARESFGKAGDILGLGSLDRVVIASPTRSAIVAVRPGYVMSVFADAGKPFSTVEKKLTEILSR
jgi:hypothetical protein